MDAYKEIFGEHWEVPKDQDIKKNEIFPFGAYIPDTRLKACPFCGRQAAMKPSFRYPRYGEKAGERIVGYTAVCVNTECIIYDCDNNYKTSEKAAAKVWNKRHAEE